jgi:predicted dehydrogenase
MSAVEPDASGREGLRVGFLGSGLIAGVHLGMLQGAPTPHSIVGVHDLDADRAAAFAANAGGVAMSTPAEVIEASDAVYVCTWTGAHAELVAQVAATGRAVFCEKPLAFDLADARTMVETVEAAGVVNQVGLVLRSMPAFRYLRHLMADPANGRLMAVVFRDDQYIPTQGYYGSTWRADPAKAGHGTLLEHSIHDLDVFEWVFGEVTSVGARSQEFHELDGIEDAVVVNLTFADGGLGTLMSIWHDLLSRPSLRWLEVFCERAYFSVDGDFAATVTWDRGNGDSGSLSGAALSDAADAVGAGWDNPADRFLRAVLDGGPASPDFRAALRPHALVDAAYASAAAGGNPCTPEPI